MQLPTTIGNNTEKMHTIITNKYSKKKQELNLCIFYVHSDGYNEYWRGVL